MQQQPRTLCSLSKKKSKLNPGFKAISQNRQEESAPGFVQDPVLPGKLMQMHSPNRAAWMLQPFPPQAALALGFSPGSTGRRDHQPPRCSGPLPQRLLWPPVPGVSSVPSAPGLSPRCSRGEIEAKLRDFCRDTERPVDCIISLESPFFSLSFVKGQFLSLHHSATNVTDGEREETYPPRTMSARGHRSSGQRHPPATYPATQKTINCLRPLFFSITLDDISGW